MARDLPKLAERRFIRSALGKGKSAILAVATPPQQQGCNG
jgi:hypothetical protein